MTELSKSRKVEIRNIYKKLTDGKTLTAREAKLIDEYEAGQARVEAKTVSLFDENAVAGPSDMVDFVGISPQRIAVLAKDGVFVKAGKGRYKIAESVRNYIRMLQKGRKSAHGTSASMEELRQKLVEEQGRKEAALASLRELELYQKQHALIPESEAIRVVVGLLTPLRRLLDAMPRQVASQCNPSEPAIAELATRNYLDERIYSTCEKIIKDLEQQTKSKQ
jgi:tRNA U55 pseudouridine synthase TruB